MQDKKVIDFSDQYEIEPHTGVVNKSNRNS